MAILGLCVPVAEGGSLVAQWDFDTGQGQAILDSSPNSLDGFLGNLPGPDAQDPLWVAGLDGSAGALDMLGTRFAQVPYSPLLQPAGSITVSALVRPSVESQRRRIVCNLDRLADNVFSGFDFDIQADNLRFEIFSSTGEMNFVHAAFDFQPGVVYDVAGSWDKDAQIMDVFVDGVNLFESITAGSRHTTIDQIGPNPGNLFIGSTSFGPSDFFLGEIDRVSIETTPIAVPVPGAFLLTVVGIAVACCVRRWCG